MWRVGHVTVLQLACDRFEPKHRQDEKQVSLRFIVQFGGLVFLSQCLPQKALRDFRQRPFGNQGQIGGP